MSAILSVRSPSVGRVLEILVEVGETVEAEDELLILESMKLEIPVSATRSGEIISIDTSVEAQVQTDEILLTIR
ncbi:MAG: acetyl-CoA carboxylase biotin carboxyl carrier protein subunit [Candidatus Binatia bacterium]|jgi:biotin carboxyl carrier protein|nr:acetyl-CoA carboxylase biotin carboxyl carrier protein subunit [Candidatus Binatia bacterium]MDG2008729.1 acetyl-CoA carboxylase biotin carboxyl carrier protein subunit [Candidatus Binatia bacterium]